MEVVVTLERGSWTFDDKSVLGEPGGFGTVYSGRGDSDVAVAIKRISLESSARREIQIAEILMDRTSKHVMPVLDAGLDQETGDYFLVMPLADRTLTGYIASETVSEGDAVEIMLAIASGLAEADDVVHRDLKPHNILELEGRWVISDYGIARMREAVTASDTLAAALTWDYAAPEQWENVRATNATDIYALGCIGHALLTGSPPFAGPGREDYSEQHRLNVPPAVDTQDPRLATLVSAMLLKGAGTRPQISEVISQLENILGQSQSATGNDAFSALSAAAAQVARDEAASEAAGRLAASQEEIRALASLDGVGVLEQLMHALGDRIAEAAPAARVSVNANDGAIALGDGFLKWSVFATSMPEGVFANSGWDVLVGASIDLDQKGPRYIGRQASLWYLRQQDGSYRWVEVSYMRTALVGGFVDERLPFALTDLDHADLAASNVMHVFQHASPIRLIDGEDASSFIERWLGLFALAVGNELQSPSRLPEE